MKYVCLLLLAQFIYDTHMFAQTTDITGDYHLEGVMETASGFQFNADSTFEFYFSYGALDRQGKGTWQVINSRLVLNSKPYPGHDFKLIEASHIQQSFITIGIREKNTVLLPYVYAFTGRLENDESPAKADSEGNIQLPLKKGIDSLHLLFEFVPERMSSFAIDTNKENNFVFSFEPWLFDVFFKEFELTVTEEGLRGKHPLLEKDDYTYLKEN